MVRSALASANTACANAKAGYGLMKPNFELRGYYLPFIKAKSEFQSVTSQRFVCHAMV
jgi:hypothetical protein